MSEASFLRKFTTGALSAVDSRDPRSGLTA